ncbi:MAG: PDZ domain-containing protein [Dehalococcoidales bacterium]|nr:MAG: PDZ domain-containing protein [Dehalococcoidales bacterium]
MVKQFLSQKGVNYEERDVSRNQAYARELVNNTGQMGVPVTVFDGEIVVGFDQQRLEQLVSSKPQAKRPSFGASIADADKITAKRGNRITSGAYVGGTRQGSAAQRIGLKQGDVITRVNKQNITDTGDLERVLAGMNEGQRILVEFQRDGRATAVEGIL